jgi:hypothetical protein
MLALLLQFLAYTALALLGAFAILFLIAILFSD